ncbi:HAMP domain-containing sensor histidine kinase [Auraticoccus monumenti]|uniref:histidine kinase n=1 Tax=Auraticoccus monumenti TaxID=675864 RepID=A0A1G6VXS8_9ACTN|nr:HAMP domain-containing sensor histidine kinase [Auraticoccus monumenti]SDD57605.1 two-component system, OmpR family, sensor kinase [Auraticoccus monumenti]
MTLPRTTAAHRWVGGTGSLQRQLLLRTLAVLAATCVLMGALTTLIARELLVGQVDRELGAAKERTQRGPLSERRDGTPPEGVDLPGQQIGTVVVVSDGSYVRYGILSEGGPDDVDRDAVNTLLGVPPDGRKQTLEVPGLGRYRVVAFLRGSDLVVVGLPLKELELVLARLVALEALLTVAALAGAAAAVRTVVVRGLTPLNRLAATAQQVSTLQLGSGEVDLAVRVPPADADPASEVGRVGVAFNHMLGNVAGALAARQASENRLRRFVADASHELRNPLAAIRGYAELTRRGSDQLPPDTTFALTRVESEAERMSRLVEDLLLLARLDSGPSVQLAPTDVSELVVNAVSDARVAGPGHQWALDLPGEPVVALADHHQLHQVVVNLLANARTHTPPGTHVTTALRAEEGWAVVTVTDDGPGIPADTVERVFERFTRADVARARVGGGDGRPSGTGLGLAIVAAVVEGHRGRVEVTSRPGETVFTVRVPLADG